MLGTQEVLVMMMKRAIRGFAIAACMAWSAQSASAHPGHGKPIDRQSASQMATHYLTEPVHVAGTLLAAASALAVGVTMFRRGKVAN